MNVPAADVEWHVETVGDPAAPALLLLHGFAGSHRTWLPVAAELARDRYLIMPDLPGHGATPVCDALGLNELADALARLCRAVTKSALSLCGYSMGGRIALHLLLRHPAAIRSSVLLGASPGIPNPAERSARRARDDALAERILSQPLAWFVNYWERQPIFASQHALALADRTALRAERLACNRDGLAAALRQWGTGVQEDLLPALNQSRSPVLLVAGEHDQKFRASNVRLESVLPQARLAIIPGAGHAAHLEQPAAFGNSVRAFLSGF
ncbi:2-succinyl-6-hydroxy-2,4-cyclohexadiene-1-carboxylate synthase [candidate division KSB1 bacterium]|nr:2-succinyl-6-hydroxy-2,4-cyclohexadiene-1-carboxylate synthase [candidate division KSB1 bacterium]